MVSASKMKQNALKELAEQKRSEQDQSILQKAYSQDQLQTNQLINFTI